ncbi:AraC family transcriptional regulator N-terminal domain-containing protein [Bordetella muralis]|uniref:AraC family transcriptional regulator n=1 Tax=Bordetella muralis TaxID=1649130 RepID=UPI0039F0781B
MKYINIELPDYFCRVGDSPLLFQLNMTPPKTLLEHVRRYADLHVDNAYGVAATPVSGIVILRETAPGPLQYAISKPLVAMVLQGSKRVSMGEHSLDFGAGESLLISNHVPTVSQIIQASQAVPYYSLVMELDTTVIADLISEIGAMPLAVQEPLRVAPTEVEFADTVLRLLRLLDQPHHLAVLERSLVRELHFWLLSGRHGGAMRALGVADSHAQRIARAVAILREKYAQPIRIETLAHAASMSISAFHTHFRSITSLTPLQFQKQLRLIEARRRMLHEGVSITHASDAVGYESVPQFTREYARLFGQPPARSIRQARAEAESAIASAAKTM